MLRSWGAEPRKRQTPKRLRPGRSHRAPSPWGEPSLTFFAKRNTSQPESGDTRGGEGDVPSDARCPPAGSGGRGPAAGRVALGRGARDGAGGGRPLRAAAADSVRGPRPLARRPEPMAARPLPDGPPPPHHPPPLTRHDSTLFFHAHPDPTRLC